MSNFRCVALDSLNKKKYKVTLEGMETVILSLYPSELRRFNIAEGEILSEANYDELMSSLYKRGKERALYYLKTSDKTAFQMRKKLKEGYYPENVIDMVMEFLIKYGYIDDTRYVENYISYNRKRKSAINMKNDLSIKGVSRDIIDNVLSECSDEREQDEEHIIEEYCRKRIKTDMDEKALEKLMMSLLRKGFRYDLIKNTVRKIQEEINFE